MSTSRARGRSRSGAVTLSEQGGVRFLHFGSPWVQGAMRIADPDRLELEYQQQMMAPLLVLPLPRQILQLGLGAGALTRFCLRHLPRARLTVVEIEPQVVRVAERYFALKEDPRLCIEIDDARDYLDRPQAAGAFDWVQVDIYDALAQGPVHDDEAFYRRCRAALREPGVASFNLFGSRFKPSFAAIAAAFEGRCCALPASDAGNRVVVALQGEPPDAAFAQLERRAAEAEIQLGLPATQWTTALAQPLDPAPGRRG